MSGADIGLGALYAVLAATFAVLAAGAFARAKKAAPDGLQTNDRTSGTLFAIAAVLFLVTAVIWIVK
ncbi:MAG TPA: hypothetical protein VFP53_00395 [Sphingomicrobium sp.]|nr:hypothetical protein [Sphingomicrobium sp.]